MRRVLSFLLIVVLSGFVWACARQASGDTPGSAQEGLKVFISVDMEGISGVVNGGETGSSGADYQRARRLTTLEANAAVEGAIAAGATEIVVRDGHGAKTNIIPELFHKGAKLLRGVTDRPENMMLGLDESFDAVVFIGYHAKAGTEGGIQAHTSSGNVIDLSVNGVSLPEAGYNAIMAGNLGVPVALVAGDNWICEQVREMLGEVATVETKVGMGTAALALHPEVVQEMIRDATADALQNLQRYEAYRMEPPYTMVLKVRRERELYPGAEWAATGEVKFTSDDFLEVMDAFNAMK
jgi:D-amino peptidase